MAEATAVDITLADGSVVKAGTPEEAIKILSKMKEDTSAALKAEREQRVQIEQTQRTMQEQIDGLRRQNQPQHTNGQFTKEHYYELLNQDPIEAQNYLDAHRFGIKDPHQVPSYFQGMASDLSGVKQQMLSGSFLQRHGGEFDPKYANALTDRFQKMIDLGHPASLDTLELAYQKSVEDHSIVPLEAKKEETKEEPPPNLTGSGGAALPTDEEQKLYRMPMSELEKVMREKGVLS